MTETRAVRYAQQTGLTTYLQTLSMSLDELEGLAVGARALDGMDGSEGSTATGATLAQSWMDMAACALSASVLQFGDDAGGEVNQSPMTRPSRVKTTTPSRTSINTVGLNGGTGEERGATVTTSGRSTAVLDGGFHTRDAAVKAEVCRTLSELTTDMLDADLSLPAELSWRQDGTVDNYWLGASLAFRTVDSLRFQAARAFAAHQQGQNLASGARAGSPPQETTRDVEARQKLFFTALLTPAVPSRALSGFRRPSFDADAEGLADFFLSAHCADFPTDLWQQALTLARTVSSITSAHIVGTAPSHPTTANASDAPLRPLRQDVLVLRCLLLHTVAPTAFSLVSAFRNPAVRTFSAAAVCADKGTVPRHVAQDVLRLESLVATRLEDVVSVNDAFAPQPLLVAVVLSKVFWLWASSPYSGAWSRFYMD